MERSVENVVEHKKYSPSQADRFLVCPGSVRLIQSAPPRPSGKEAEDGTKAHKLLELTLRNGFENAYQTIKELELGYHNNEMIMAVNDAIAYIHSLYEELNLLYGDPVLYVEVYVDPPCNAAPQEAGGYVDVAIYSAIGRQLYVIDYKHGVGIYKAAKGNKQVTQYGAGFLFGEQRLVEAENIDSVTLVIIQPRSFHEDGEIREYDMTPSEVYDYLLELEEGVIECEKEDAPLVPGYEHCQMCPAKSSCPALEASSVQLIDQKAYNVRDIKKPNMPDPKGFDMPRLSYVLNNLNLIKLWIKDVETHAKELAMGGHNPPGFKLVNSSERRHWHGEPDKVAPRLAALIGCPPDDLFDRKFITITEAEKRVKASFKKRVSKKKRRKAAEDASKAFAYFTTKQASGNYSLVPEEDPRPSVHVAQQVFGDIGTLIPSTDKEK